MSYVTVQDLRELQNPEMAGFRKSFKRHFRRVTGVVKKGVGMHRRIRRRLGPMSRLRAKIRAAARTGVKKVGQAVKRIPKHKTLRKVGKKFGRYFYLSPIAWKRTAKKYKAQLMTAGKIVIPVAGAILAPFTGGASALAAAAAVQGIRMKEQHDAMKVAMQKGRRQERAVIALEARQTEKVLAVELDKLYREGLETHFLPLGYTDTYWEPLTVEQKLWLVEEINAGRAVAVKPGAPPVTVPPGRMKTTVKPSPPKPVPKPPPPMQTRPPAWWSQYIASLPAQQAKRCPRIPPKGVVKQVQALIPGAPGVTTFDPRGAVPVERPVPAKLGPAAPKKEDPVAAAFPFALLLLLL